MKAFAKEFAMDDLLREFLTETNESLDVVDVELVRFEHEPNNAKILANIFRLVHTIKGTCGFLGLPRLEALAHAAETLMGRFRDGMPVTAEAVTLILATIDRVKAILEGLEATQQEPDGDDRDLIAVLEGMVLEGIALEGIAQQECAAETVEPAVQAPVRAETQVEAQIIETQIETQDVSPTEAFTPAAEKSDHGREAKIATQTIRVNVGTLEHLMTMVSELVLTRNQLLEIVRRHEDSEFKVPLQRLSNVTAELQEGVMKTRMQPIGHAWQKLPRIVRDLSAELGKEIELEMLGAETELDRQVLEHIKDPLTHLVRNCADHGIDTPMQRLAAGKPEKGTIRLSAYQEGGHIIIEVGDDGRGLDAARIKARAMQMGLASEAELEHMTEAQIYRFIFAPGFSTAPKVTNVSGRGVGMDVVRNNIDQIGGTIDLKSVPGEGATFIIKIPLTLAIVSALIVEAGGERLAIPQLSVVELVRARTNGEHRIERIKDTAVLRLREKLLPLVHLKELLGIGRGDTAEGFVVVTQVGSDTFGIVVDGVFHTEEIVVKPMSSKLRHIGMFSGNTILGDGSVILIIDPNGIAQALGSAARTRALARQDHAASQDRVIEQNMSLLVFRAGSQQPKAVPLSLVTRLEEIDCRTIEIANGRHLVQYRGQLMPLVSIDGETRVRGEGAQPLLVFSDSGRSMGLVVDEIVDIVEDRLDIEVSSDRPGILGSAVIKGHATEIVDVGHFLPLAFEDWFRRKERPGPNAARTVLLVDDSDFFRNMLTPVLKAAGFRVIAVPGAADALSLMKAGQGFDVVVTDIEMPDMNGFEFAEALRGNPRTAAIPIIGLSAMASPEAVERGREVGFHDLVAKFDRAGLVAAVKEQSADLNRAA
jgi:two-component system chemotaxis sensor kinase CheA